MPGTPVRRQIRPPPPSLLAGGCAHGSEQATAADCVRLGRQLLDGHALFDALEILRAGLGRWPDDVGLRQVMALAWSRRVRGLVAGRLGRLGTTRRQFAALLEHAGHDRRLVDGWLPMPAVVLFAGDMIDLPGRPAPRLPEERCPAAAAAIRAWLAARDVGFGFSSAAGGGDILFQEALAAAGAERCVVLPFPEEEFLRTSVDRNGTGRWASRLRGVIDGARLVCVSRSPLWRAELAYDYADRLIIGLARHRADRSLGAVLFADGLGFSRLPDTQVPPFVETFLGRIAAVVDRYGRERITVRETLG